MKKMLLALPLMLLFACSANQEKTKTTEGKETEKVVAETKKYACPMKCEADKTYDKEGKCPVCHMDLQEVALVETDSTSHVH